MQDAIEALLPNAAVSRIGGTNRYETNAMYSAATFPIEGWASIPAAAFIAPSPASDVVAISQYAYNITNGVLHAPIQLPHGAEILELKADAYDTDNGAGIGVTLYRVNNAGAGLDAASASSGVTFSAGDTTVSDTTITAGAKIVDNENYTYLVKVTGADGSPYIFNVKVRYRLGVSTG
jgi:hypothetical protein